MPMVLVMVAAACAAPATRGTVAAPEKAAAEPVAAEPTLAPQRLGTPFRYRETFSDDTAPVDWQVTVTAARCGATVLPMAADNPAYVSGDWPLDKVPPTHIDARPPAGWVFCRLDATLENVGRSPASGVEEFGNLVTSRGEYTFTEADKSIAENLQEAEKLPGGPFNPGTTARVIKIWTVPAGTTAEAVLFPQESLWDQPAHRIALS